MTSKTMNKNNAGLKKIVSGESTKRNKALIRDRKTMTHSIALCSGSCYAYAKPTVTCEVGTGYRACFGAKMF